jgi:nitrate reductase assembly molybdenum cofactor insertion protein NarJ
MSAPEVLVARARELVLASTLAGYPDPELVEIVVDLELAAHPGAGAMRQALVAYDGRDGRDGLADLRARYVALFDRGGRRASLYETEYGRMRGMSKGKDLADVAGFYQAFGLLQTEERHEMLDHIAVELEFYAVLLLKQAALARTGDAVGIEIVMDARRKFLAEHLGGLARAVAERGEVTADPIYAAVFTWTWGLVADECAGLGVAPEPLDFFPDEDARGELTCGAVHLPVLA